MVSDGSAAVLDLSVLGAGVRVGDAVLTQGPP